MATTAVLSGSAVEDFSPETTTRDAYPILEVSRGSEVADGEYDIIS